MSQFYIGIDIGTTATKAVVFDSSGKVVREVSKGYEMYHPKADWSVQKIDEVLSAVLSCIQEITEGIQPEFISFSSAMQSILMIDEQGNPLSDAILWADNRASGLAESLKNSSLGKQFYQLTGIPIHTFCPMTKILWWKENEPELFAKSHRFISIKEYIWHHLTGEYVLDSSMASGTGLMNLNTLDWEKSILDHLHITEAQLSPIVPVTHRAKGKLDGYLYILGGGDGALANLGSGAMERGKMALTIGTSGAVRLPIEKPFIDAQMRTQCYHLKDDRYLVLGAVNNGAVILQWLKEAILKTDMSFDVMIEEAKDISAGSDDLLFVPYLLGERAPIWDASAKGSLLGISIHHTQAHLIRATLEGILFGLLSIAEILFDSSEERKKHVVMASGGFAKSDVWLQMAADIFQMEIVVAETVESAAWGAVMLGFEALKITYDIVTNEGKHFVPNPDNQVVYEQQFSKFKKVYTCYQSLAD